MGLCPLLEQKKSAAAKTAAADDRQVISYSDSDIFEIVEISMHSLLLIGDHCVYRAEGCLELYLENIYIRVGNK
jgi:hypothetical protein